METASLFHSVLLKAGPAEVYDILMDEKRHAAVTGMKAKISRKEGGRFLTCGIYNFGYHLILNPAERIVQAWSHIDFPEHHYSIVDFQLAPTPNNGTRLSFYHYGIPPDALEWLDSGWHETYWEPLKEYCKQLP